MEPTPFSAGFQSIPPLPTIKPDPSGAGSRVGGPVHTLGPCGSLQRPPVRRGVSPAAAPTSTGIFNQRFEALFPCAGALGYVVCFAAHCSGLSGSVGPQGLRLSRTPPVSVPPKPCESSPPRCLSPPLLLVWMNVHFFYLLGVRLPCRSIFCQFWLCEEAQCVYLCRHLGSWTNNF